MARKIALKSATEEIFKNTVSGISWNEAAGGKVRK